MNIFHSLHDCPPGLSMRSALYVIVIAGVFSALPIAQSADVDTSKWLCESCPFDRGYRGDYRVGSSHVSDDAAKFGDASGYEEQGIYLNLDGDGIYINDDYRLSWELEDLGLDSRSVLVDGGQPGIYAIQFAYRELPHHLFDTTSTIFSSNGSNVLNEPDNWVNSGLTSGFTALDDNLRSRDIESERKNMMLDAKYRASSRIEFGADYRHLERNGNDIMGGSFFTQSSLLPRVLDYQTDDVTFSVRYLGARGQLALAYASGWFQNTAWSVTWDHPFITAPGADQGRMAQEPDNQYHQISLSGNYRLDTYDTVMSLSTSFGQHEQNDAFLPYTINPNLSGLALPRQQLDGKVDTTHLALTATARPHRKAQVRLAYRFDKRDNQTPRDLWQRVIVDSFASGAAEMNTPYSFEKLKLNLSTTIDLIDNIKVSAGFNRAETDRELQEVAEQTENDSWGQVRWRPRPAWEVSVKGGIAKREIDRYDTSLAARLGQNPLLRKYNLAYRYREYGDIKLVAALANTPLTLSASARFANDNYSQSALGLQGSDDLSYTADIDWAVSDKTSLYFNGGWDQIEAVQNGSESFGPSDWRATHDDQFFTGSAGFMIRGISGKADLVMDYTHSDGSSAISVDSSNSGVNRFPDLESTRDAIRLSLDYRYSKQLTASVQLAYETFDVRDWALEGVDPDTIPTILTLGADPYDYDVFVIGLGFRYSLSQDEISLR